MPFPTKFIINLLHSGFGYCKPTFIRVREIFESLVIWLFLALIQFLNMSSYFCLGQGWDRCWWQGPEGTVGQPEEGEQWTQHQTQTARRWTQERGQASHHHGEWGGKAPVITPAGLLFLCSLWSWWIVVWCGRFFSLHGTEKWDEKERKDSERIGEEIWNWEKQDF